MPRTPEEEEAIKKAADLLDYGERPPGPIAAPQRSEGIFSLSDLADLEYRSEWFQMTRKTGFYVHPVSLTEGGWLNCQALRRLKAEGVQDPGEQHLIATRLAQVFQVIQCCRVGPEPEAALVFEPSAWESLYRDRRIAGKLQEICILSDALTNDQETLQDRLRRFFERLQRFMQTCASQLSMDSLETSRAALEACASSVSAMNSTGRLPLESIRFPE